MTLLPALAPDEVEAELPRLRGLLGRHRPFPFELVDFGRFDERILYLAPAPGETFVALMEAVGPAYPDRLPYGGAHAGREPTPRCTIAASGDGASFIAAEAALRPHLPLEALAVGAWLVELRAEGWSVRARLPFRGRA